MALKIFRLPEFWNRKSVARRENENLRGLS